MKHFLSSYIYYNLSAIRLLYSNVCFIIAFNLIFLFSFLIISVPPHFHWNLLVNSRVFMEYIHTLEFNSGFFKKTQKISQKEFMPLKKYFFLFCICSLVFIFHLFAFVHLLHLFTYLHLFVYCSFCTSRMRWFWGNLLLK